VNKSDEKSESTLSRVKKNKLLKTQDTKLLKEEEKKL